MSSTLKHLLIVYHSKSGTTRAMAEAVRRGAEDPDIEDVEVRYLPASDADADDLRWCDGVALGTPENFGYMSGALKDFFDRTFYEVTPDFLPRPYVLFVACENDGRGAVTAVERIVNGYPLTQVQAPVIQRAGEDRQAECEALGATLAAGLSLGMF